MPGLSHDSPLSTPMLLGLLLAASTLSRCETSSGCRGGDQHLGEYTNTSPSVSGDVTLVDPVVGGSPLLRVPLGLGSAAVFSCSSAPNSTLYTPPYPTSCTND